jgi:hypothetical protein
MSTERPQRHVLDELLAKSVQAPPDGGRGSWAPGAPDPAEPPPIERTAPPEAPAWPSRRTDGAAIDGRGDDARDAAMGAKGERRGPILRDTRAREGSSRRHDGFASAEGEVQVGRGPLALHLSRAATEERLAESEERLAQSEKRLQEARHEIDDREARLATSAERTTQASERLAQAEKRLAALEERLMMTEESERHAAEQQARAEESRETLAAQISALEVRERELRAEHQAERAARARVESELERLRGSFATLTPLVHALHQATGDIQSVLAQEPEAGAAHGGGSGGNAGGEGGITQAPPAAAHSHAPPPPIAVPPPPPAPMPGAPGGPIEHGEAGLLRALVDVVERWRAHGANS